MKSLSEVLIFIISVLLIGISPLVLNAQYQDYPITPIPFSKVMITDDFWASRIKTNHEVTIPIAFEQGEKTGRIDNFRVAADLKEGTFCSIYPFDDSDIFKIVEGASYSLMTYPDPELEIKLDSLIELFSQAQEEDGYLYTNRTIGKPVHEWAGDQRWQLVHELSHELYNMGHLFEAGVAHFQATGKENLLNVALKAADLICSEFGEGKIQNVPGHQEVELGLIKLYRLTKDEKYLNTAKFFLDIRGRKNVGNPKKYDQSHIPVVQQTKAVGHAVRGAYMWSAMADIAAITGDKSYLTAINQIWEDIVSKKYYINGGIGATGDGEAFGEPYELPNISAYCETCAGVGNAMWNHRMFLMHGDAKYIDVLERTMYNNILDGVSLSGDRFFYPNPLSSNGQHARKAWFGCACCPPNVSRFLPSMPGYIYAKKGNEIFVNLYISNETNIDLNGKKFQITQESEFPWEGRTVFSINPQASAETTFKFRVPGYVRAEPVPSDLYIYEDSQVDHYEVTLNGEKANYSIDNQNYITITRKWDKDDELIIDFNFKINVVKPHEAISANSNKIAFERGPLLYCAEWSDNADHKVRSSIVDNSNGFKIVESDILGGIKTIHGQSRKAYYNLDGSVSLGDRERLLLIPYHLWNNRGPGEMNVWIATSIKSSNPEPAPTIARKSLISASGDIGSVKVISDQAFPKHSNDKESGYIHWWPKTDSWETITFKFEDVQQVSELDVFWFDDGPHGGCRIPEEVRIEYLNNGQWKEVKERMDFEILKDTLNHFKFRPLKTKNLRLIVKLQEEFSTGIYEVVIK